MSLISRVWGLQCSWSWQRAEKLWGLGNAWSRLSQHPPRSGEGLVSAPLGAPCTERGCRDTCTGRGAQGGTAVAGAGTAPATSPCRVRYKLNQTLPERKKSGNMRRKFYGRKDVDPNPP